MAVKFTPPDYPWTFDLARFWPWSSSAGLDVEIHVWDDDGPGGLPGRDIITPFAYHMNSSDQWTPVGLPRLTVTNGSFYIGWIQPQGPLYYNARDDDNSSAGRSYVLSSTQGWVSFVDLGETHDLMLRQGCSD